LTVREPLDIIIVKEVKPMKDKRQLSDKELWGFEWDDIEKAAKEMRESTFGPDRDIPPGEKFCFECGEISSEKVALYCIYCGYSYEGSRLARKYMAYNIDIAWPLMNAEQRAKYKQVMNNLRLVAPEFRQMWQKEADQAALDRRYA
jgi:hypothetical protein